MVVTQKYGKRGAGRTERLWLGRTTKAITCPRSGLQGEGAHAAARREAAIAPLVGLSVAELGEVPREWYLEARSLLADSEHHLETSRMQSRTNAPPICRRMGGGSGGGSGRCGRARAPAAVRLAAAIEVPPVAESEPGNTTVAGAGERNRREVGPRQLRIETRNYRRRTDRRMKKNDDP